MIERKIKAPLKDALTDSSVVLLHGARQTGKSTLIQSLIEKEYDADYITLDDSRFLSAAISNPSGFLESFDSNLAIDEVQRAPGLLPEIKKIVDKNRKPGKFILTGSANVLLVPRVAESLAGRMEILNLFPFSQNEMNQSNFNLNLVNIFFDEKIKLPGKSKKSKVLIDRIILGGYPEVQTRKTTERRNAWFNSYITSILQRDVRELSNIEGITQLPRLLSLFAARAGSLLNIAEFSRSSAIAQTTLKRYIVLLQSAFLIYLLPAYSGNLSKRLIRTPKAYLYDTGLLSYLISADENRFNNDPSLWGVAVENFVLMELLKQISWYNKPLHIYYFRTSSGQEVDFVVERNDGYLIGIEVKTTHSPRAEMFNGLKYLASEMGKRFVRGYLLYNGQDVVPY